MNEGRCVCNAHVLAIYMVQHNRARRTDGSWQLVVCASKRPGSESRRRYFSAALAHAKQSVTVSINLLSGPQRVSGDQGDHPAAASPACRQSGRMATVQYVDLQLGCKPARPTLSTWRHVTAAISHRPLPRTLPAARHQPAMCCPYRFNISFIGVGSPE